MRLLIISNRAPVSIVNENGDIRYEESSGGLISGLSAWLQRMKKKHDITWIGWPGGMADDEKKVGADILKKFGVKSVFLDEEVMHKFYDGFCNKTLWPLFHYFPGNVIYDSALWGEYMHVNEIFRDAVLETYKPGDLIWVHDYHLLLLPVLLREKIPEASIGFFLHIPFPSYELFRLLPGNWRKKIIEGTLGADLIGFHTHDYCTYFLQSTQRIAGLSHHMNEVMHEGRQVKAGTFPMGIDFRKYHSAASGKGAEKEKVKLRKNLAPVKRIISIDRQDYSKGILNRLKGYESFLEKNPQWKQRVTLLMVVVPSRINVEDYQSIKSHIDELVGNINGKFGSLEWTPILYQYRSLTFDELLALYTSSDVALVTPLRDGMNLVAKEYIASRTNHRGVLILSEMAGAADELDQSIIINPNNIDEISQAILHALEMPDKEQKEKIKIMQQRVKKYDVFRWADDFLKTLGEVKAKQLHMDAKKLSASERKKIIAQCRSSASRIFFLDYDGTLSPHVNNPADAKPQKQTLHLLKKLVADRNTRVVLISGRDKFTMEKWFKKLPVELAAEHGVLLKEKSKNWRTIMPLRKAWKKRIISVLKEFTEKLPGSHVEEKEFSLVFHYRKCDPVTAADKTKELVNMLENLTMNMEVSVHEGNKIIELRNAGIGKGAAAMHWLAKMKNTPRFVLAIGNDETDEDLFRSMPPDACTIKVGEQPSNANFNLKNPKEVIELLEELAT